MSSLPEMYNDREIESPFSFRADEYDGKGELLHKGYSYRESMEAAMPSFARIQKMHLTERFFTKRMLYILQFLYELGPLTAKEIEWAFLHPKVEPYERKIGLLGMTFSIDEPEDSKPKSASKKVQKATEERRPKGAAKTVLPPRK